MQDIHIIQTSKAPIKIFANDHIFAQLQSSKALVQARNVAQLPGIVGPSIVMPDAHQGYGFCIGGVAAFDTENGVISPGGIGFDINCGIRLQSTNLTESQIQPFLEQIMDAIFAAIPVGKGKEGSIRLTHEELDEVLIKGMHWAKEKGYATDDDVLRTENDGCIADADPTKISPRAKKRGKNQLGTLGAGNHFVELQVVDEIYDEDVAQTFKLKKGNVCIMVHSGSRGIGHQTCSEYLRRMEEEHPEIAQSLPERDLMYAPISSQVAKDYFGAMSACANFAWVSRFLMATYAQNAIKSIILDAQFASVYDVAHNICKKETHTFEGKTQEVYVHRKGATRAFPSGHEDNPSCYAKTGHPVLIPGSMGTDSFVLVGTQKGMEESFGSTAHGSGRVMGRKVAFESIDPKKVMDDLNAKGIIVKSSSSIADEAPQVYKDSAEVVSISESTGIGKIIAKLRPIGVVKG